MHLYEKEEGRLRAQKLVQVLHLLSVAASPVRIGKQSTRLCHLQTLPQR